MNFLNLFKHLLPRARAWRITIDKTLRQYFDGLSKEPEQSRLFFDQRFYDIFPTTTTAIKEMLEQFNLLDTGDDATNRLNLAAAWRLNEYQSETDIQNALQAAGFDVYVHEWWLEPVSGSPVAVDPRPLVGGDVVSLVSCGEPDMLCQEPIALCGNFDVLGADVLVNKTGLGIGFALPDDPTKWPFFFYVGAETFPNKADVPLSRKTEFESLLLKISPTQQWIGLLINYV